jgi:hypothetical protein
MDGISGYVLDFDPWGCPTGCAFVEEHVGDGVGDDEDVVERDKLARPSDMDKIWDKICGQRALAFKTTNQPVASNIEDVPSACKIAKKDPLPNGPKSVFQSLRWGGSFVDRAEKESVIDA